jgi:hypothetical protein
LIGPLWFGIGRAYEVLGLYKEAQLSYDKSNRLAEGATAAQGK